MDSFNYDPGVFGNMNYPGIDVNVPDIGMSYGGYQGFDESPYYNDSAMFKQQGQLNPGLHRHPPVTCVKTENPNPVHHGLYTNPPLTPVRQFQVGETAFFGGRGTYMSGSPSGPPVSPYGNHSVSEGTVSSTVSSPRSPFLRDDDELNTRVSDDQLTQMSARDLNKYFKDYSPGTISQLKKKRRTLKNRGYALNSRMKRVQQKNELEDEKHALQDKVKDLQSEIDQLKKELDVYKRKASTYEELLSNSTTKSSTR